MNVSSPLPLLLIALFLTGCSTPFMTDRERDAADIFTASLGRGAGIKARTGPFQVGLFGNRDKIGLRGGQFHGNLDFSGPGGFDEGISGAYLYGCSSTYDYTFTLFSLESFYSPDKCLSCQRGKNLKSFGVLGITPINLTSCNRNEINKSSFTQLEVAMGLGFTVRLGFNPGEALDFLAGWIGIDLYNDDLAKSIPVQYFGVVQSTVPHLIEMSPVVVEAARTGCSGLTEIVAHTNADNNGTFRFTAKARVEEIRAETTSALGTQYSGTIHPDSMPRHDLRIEVCPEIYLKRRSGGDFPMWLKLEDHEQSLMLSAIRKIVQYQDEQGIRACLSLDAYRDSNIISRSEHEIFVARADAMQRPSHCWEIHCNGLGIFTYRDSTSPASFSP